IADARARQARTSPAAAARNDMAPPALPTVNAQARPTNLPPSIVGTTPAAPGMSPARQKAMTVMAEARLLAGSNRFVEARNKVVEAQTLHAEFGPEEEQPARLLLELNGEAQKRIDAAVGQAMTALQSDHSAPMVAQVHSTLTQAKAFAVAMNL